MLWGVIALLLLALFETGMEIKRYRRDIAMLKRKIEFDKENYKDIKVRIDSLELNYQDILAKSKKDREFINFVYDDTVLICKHLYREYTLRLNEHFELIDKLESKELEEKNMIEISHLNHSLNRLDDFVKKLNSEMEKIKNESN
jgi:hypothetical protein